MKIETERTIIRLPKTSDFNFLKEMWLNGEVMKYVGFPNGLKVSDEDINSWVNNANENRMRLIVDDRETGQPIAETGWQKDTKYPYANGRKSASLDIKIVKPFWGRGYGTEILKALIDYIFQNTSLEVLFVDPNIENAGAIRLYEKLGFEKIGEPTLYTKRVQIPINNQNMEIKKPS